MNPINLLTEGIPYTKGPLEETVDDLLKRLKLEPIVSESSDYQNEDYLLMYSYKGIGFENFFGSVILAYGRFLETYNVNHKKIDKYYLPKFDSLEDAEKYRRKRLNDRLNLRNELLKDKDKLLEFFKNNSTERIYLQTCYLSEKSKLNPDKKDKTREELDFTKDINSSSGNIILSYRMNDVFVSKEKYARLLDGDFDHKLDIPLKYDRKNYLNPEEKTFSPTLPLKQKRFIKVQNKAYDYFLKTLGGSIKENMDLISSGEIENIKFTMLINPTDYKGLMEFLAKFMLA